MALKGIERIDIIEGAPMITRTPEGEAKYDEKKSKKLAKAILHHAKKDRNVFVPNRSPIGQRTAYADYKPKHYQRAEQIIQERQSGIEFEAYDLKLPVPRITQGVLITKRNGEAITHKDDVLPRSARQIHPPEDSPSEKAA